MAPAPTPPTPGKGTTLGHKVGPLPLAVWLAAGAVLGVVWWLHSRSKAAAAPVATDPGMAADTATGSAFLNSAGGGTLGGTAGHFADNVAWYGSAMNALIGSGYDPLTAAAALSDYLAGAPLSTAEQALVSLALGRVGSPPAPPLTGGGGITAIPPPSTPGPPPVSGPGPVTSPAPGGGIGTIPIVPLPAGIAPGDLIGLPNGSEIFTLLNGSTFGWVNPLTGATRGATPAEIAQYQPSSGLGFPAGYTGPTAPAVANRNPVPLPAVYPSGSAGRQARHDRVA